MNPKVRHILIVDDEPNVRLVFRTALAAPDRTVSTAENGEAALAILAHAPCDLVLLDLHMPGMDGMEVLEQIRRRGLNVPVVIVTAHGKIPDVVRAMRLGAIDFLAKPLTPEALRGTADEVILRHEPERAADAAHRPDGAAVTASSQFALNLSRAKRALNDRATNEAEVYLKQALALDPKSAEAHNLMGVVHECRNEHDAAYREYKAALKADRHHEPAKHNMTRYYERFTFGHSDLPLDTGAG